MLRFRVLSEGFKRCTDETHTWMKHTSHVHLGHVSAKLRRNHIKKRTLLFFDRLPSTFVRLRQDGREDVTAARARSRWH